MNDAVVFGPGEGEPAGAAVMKATAEMTNGAFSMSEGTLPPGFAGPPPHAHEHTTDTFYVLEGTLHVRIGDREIDAAAGSYVLVPPGVVHTFSNASDAPCRMLNINSPGGWENYLRDITEAMSKGSMPDSDDFKAVVARYDFVFPEAT